MDWEQLHWLTIVSEVDAKAKNLLGKLWKDSDVAAETLLAIAIEKGLSRIASERRYKAKHG